MTGCADSEEFRKRLLHEAGVAVLADIHFGRRVPGDGQHIRFSYAASQRGDRAAASSGSPRSCARTVADDGRRRSTTTASRATRSSVACARRCGKPGDDARRARRRRALRRRARARPAARDAGRPRRAIRRARDRHGEHGRAHRVARRRFRRRSRAISTRSSCPPAIAEQKSHAGVCWPEFADLDWSGAGPRHRGAADAGPRSPRHHRLPSARSRRPARSCSFRAPRRRPRRRCCRTRTSPSLRATASSSRHGRRVRAASARRSGRMPRAINLISGPSRTGDIEQTIVLGAHGPYRVHVLLLRSVCDRLSVPRPSRSSIDRTSNPFG